MRTLERIAIALERIAVALEPAPKPLVKLEPAPAIVKEERKPLVFEVEKTAVPKCKYKGFYGLQNFRKYGIKEGEAADLLRDRDIDVYRINGHQYCEEKYYKMILEELSKR